MSDHVENHTLQMLRRQDGKLDQLLDVVRDLGGRVTRLEASQAETARHLAASVAGVEAGLAAVNDRLDGIDRRLDRVERRLELVQ